MCRSICLNRHELGKWVVFEPSDEILSAVILQNRLVQNRPVALDVPIDEVQGWIMNTDGNVILMAQASGAVSLVLSIPARCNES